LPNWRSPELAAGYWVVLPPMWHQGTRGTSRRAKVGCSLPMWSASRCRRPRRLTRGASPPGLLRSPSRAETDRVAGEGPPKAQTNPGALYRSPGAFLGIATGSVRDEGGNILIYSAPRQRGNRVAAGGVRNLFLKESEGANRCAGDRKAAFGRAGMRT
jgi:hypothetical protein